MRPFVLPALLRAIFSIFHCAIGTANWGRTIDSALHHQATHSMMTNPNSIERIVQSGRPKQQACRRCWQVLCSRQAAVSD